MRRSPRAHYVGHNAVTRVPSRYVYLDTEARRTFEAHREVQTFRLAVAAFDCKRRDKNQWREREWIETTEPEALWRWIGERCARRARTVLVAHNLAYDLRIADAFTILPALGWTFKAGRVDGGQTWFIFTNEGRTLCMVDTMSWVPTALDRLGAAIGVPKLPLPADDDTEAEWFARCRRDVEILADVWRRLMRWVVTDDLGNWKLSGAGQSWAAFRHRFMRHDLLVHECDDARDAERAAAMTGRCEAWRHGELDGGPWTEYDFTTAYARIGAECAVPIRLCGEMSRPNLVTIYAPVEGRTVLALVTVTTDVPTLATRTNQGIVWPVGTFETYAWLNELTEAIAYDARVTVQRAWVYRTAPALEGFCSWVLDGIEGRRADVDPVVRVALKHWSRALIGRTAAQWSSWAPWGVSPNADVALSDAYYREGDERFELLQLGHQLIRRTGAPDNPDAMVSIMSWVMAEARVRLWRAMMVAGIETLAYCDTDSLIVDPRGAERLERAALPGLRVKGQWSDLRVLGPRQIIPGGQLRAAGVPRGAVPAEGDVWVAGTWSGLSTSLRTGETASVEIAARRYQLHGTDNRRIHHQDGSTSAVSADAFAAVSARIPA